MQKILLLSIPFLMSSCYQAPIENNNIQKPVHFVQNDKIKDGTGGNNEVYKIHLCLKKDTPKKQQVCLDNFYPKEKRISIYYAKNVITPQVYTREVHTKIREFNLSNKDKFIIHLNLKDIKNGIHSNIKEAMYHQDSQNVTIIINLSDIDKKVIIYNKENKILEEYQIIK